MRGHDRFVALQADFEAAIESLVCKFCVFLGFDQDWAITQVAERFKRLFESASNPVLEDGYIPPILACTEAEVRLWFGSNAHRERLLERIHTWVSLARAVKAKRLLLDGSFVTAKSEPGDVDAVVLLPEDFRDRVRAAEPEAVELYDMLRSREPKELFCAEDEEDWWRWFEFFSRTREATGRRKGLIEVTL